MGTESHLRNAREQHLPMDDLLHVTLTLDQLADLTYESARRYLATLSGLKADRARAHSQMIASRALLDLHEYAEPRRGAPRG